jgi:hypothetical protein
MFIVEFIRFAYPSTIAIFLANVNFPIHFLYYIRMFKSRLTDEFVLSSLLVECFVRALISKTVETVNDALPGAEKAKFLEKSLHHRTGDAFASISRKRACDSFIKARASILTRTSRIRACPTARPSDHHQRHFHTHTQTQPERAAAAQMARLGLFRLDCICR